MDNCTLATVEATKATFEEWATLRTNWELAMPRIEKEGVPQKDIFPLECTLRMNSLLLLLRQQAEPLISLAESYGIDAESLRAICHSERGGENEDKRVPVRAMLDKLVGAVIRDRRNQQRRRGKGPAFSRLASFVGHNLIAQIVAGLVRRWFAYWVAKT